MSTLYQRWIEAKKLEAFAIAERREVEDQMVKEFAVPKDLDGTMKLEVEGYSIKMEGRINKKVDSEKLQLLAAEAGLSEHLSALFRWRPELNTKAWNSAAEAVTKPLLDAITSTAGRPTFTITKE